MPVWPQDEADAGRMFDRALKQYHSLYKKLASGLDYDEKKTVVKKLIAAKDRLSDLYRWVDVRRKEVVLPTIQSAEDLGREAASQKRAVESTSLRQQHRERFGTGALGEYNKELAILNNVRRR
jgi:hypothetical protein